MGIVGIGGAKRGTTGTRLAPLPCRPAPPPPPHSRCSLMLCECPGAQAEVDGEIVGIGGTKRGDIGCSRSGMGE